jgi:hypothetical protein
MCFLFAQSVSAATYYCDFGSGSDGNAGTSESAPWQRQPYMAGFAGKYSHAAGDKFIFKGGTTWTSKCFPLNINAAGSGSTNDYYGVDLNWFAGSTFTRPIFDGGYAVDTIVGIESNVTLDNLELRYVSSSASDGWGIVVVTTGSSGNTLIENCWLHGWKCTGHTDGAHGGYYAYAYTASTIATNVMNNTEISNTESPNNGTCVRFGGKIINSKIHNTSSAILFCTEVTNSQVYNVNGDSFDPTPYHTNGIYLDCETLGQTVGYIRGCLIHDIGGGANAAYLNCRGASQYCYNNIFYGTFSAQRPIEIEPYAYGDGGNQGNVYIWNNTIVNDAAGSLPISIVNRGGSPQPKLVQVQNNLVINANTLMGGGPAGTITQDHNLMITTAQATAGGYTQNNLWAPSSSSNPSVDIGTSTPAGIFTTDILGGARPQGKAWDVGAYEYGSAPSATPTPSPSATPAGTPQTPQNLHLTTS